MRSPSAPRRDSAWSSSDPIVRAKLPLLAKVMPLVGHAPTRARGTVGGSLANGDPAAEIALVAVDARRHPELSRRTPARSTSPASDFFLGPMMTALPPAACLTAVRFPVWRDERIGVGFHEVSARQSDFAFVSAAAQIALDADGTLPALAVGIGAATAIADAARRVGEALAGTRLDGSGGA